MRRHSFVLALSLFGCSERAVSEPAREDEPVDDAGQANDGSSDDAGGTSDLPDAGEALVDAGGVDAGSEPAPCNGHVELCSRKFDEVAYPCTHNAHAAEEYGYSTLNRNQSSGFGKQLEDGVRCMLADVYDKSGEHLFCHNPDLCFLGSLGHVEGLAVIKAFLDEHPREVLTLIYQNGMSGDLIAEDMRSVGLDGLAFTYDEGTGFPTLGEMIAQNRRLVVTLESGDASVPWIRNVWGLTWDTPYTFFEPSEFNCDLNRGSRDAPLFLLNHWMNSRVPILNIEMPDEGKASTSNAFELLHGRARSCWDETGDMPNFITVDFYEHGDLFRVVDALNGVQ